ncbi:SIMPL domain-containing protein [Actinoplanes sp. KI2]|uniref:SIMPL domain-containing protein n=1 Tax=Actinoplanes sp. KI2 TaxID=2983315 RepID=UPI0021D56AF7|nr:SIMPL domain-containing protein [Actinoplanes sp. KI2]MCU7724238.1 SIMPL domain-containing protein [Actinoplanes sp. KI2]
MGINQPLRWEMFRSRATTPVLVALAVIVVQAPLSLGGGPAFASAAATMDSPPADQAQDSVLVTGTGEVGGEPDTLTADFGVETTASTVAQALQSANTAANRMRDSLIHAGITRADLQTSNLTIGTKVDDKQAVIGYTVSEGLTATIRNLGRAGELMSAAIAAGGDAARLNGVSFAIENDTALLTKARKKAFADARRKATLYAGEAGRSLGRVLKVSEAAPSDGGPVTHYFGPAAMSAPFPIDPGRQQLAVTVTVEWALAMRKTGPATG